MKKLYISLLTLFILFSCEVDKGPDPDYVTERNEIVSFDESNSSLFVQEGKDNEYEVVVGLTVPSKKDVNFAVLSTDKSNAVEGVDYDIEGSFLIPAGDLVASFTIKADFENASLDGKLIQLEIKSDEADVLPNKSTFDLTLLKSCPIEADFTGTYTLSIVQTGIYDTPTFTPGTVELVANGATEFDRSFSAKPYPSFGDFDATTFSFSIVCGRVLVPAGQFTGVGCGSSTELGPSENFSSFDASDDSSIEITFADDLGGASCGVEVEAIILLTKQ